MDPKAGGVPPTYTPPLHGTVPHGQGTVGVVDLTPENTGGAAYPADPADTGEEVVIGQSRGEQGSSGYNGKVTLLYLFGNPIVQVTSDPGETNEGPLDPIQTELLDAICEGSDGQACITLLKMHSSSTGNSSENAFELLGVHLGGEEGLLLDVATSDGNINDDGTCQSAHGDSRVAELDAGGNDVLTAFKGSSDSTACQGQPGTVNNSSTVLELGGEGLPIPVDGCADGTANSTFEDLAPLLATVCNADDTNGSQTDAPYGVREALTAFVLLGVPEEPTALLKASLGAQESHAVAPGGPGGPGGPGDTGTGGTKGAGGKGGGAGGQGGGGAGGAGGAGAGGGAGAAAGAAGAGNGELAFTGADLLILGLIGGALVLGGLVLTTTAGRRHRQTV